MQIATLSYRYKPKENGHDDHRAKLSRRQILTTITTNSTKKIKSRRSLHSDLTRQSSNGQLPPINSNSQRRSSIRIQGSSLPSSKLGESSAFSFHQPSRSRSRQSISSNHLDGRSRSITPVGMMRPTSRLVRMRFGYPVKLRTPDFYGPDRSEEELQLREDSFVNDSIRAAHQYRQSAIIPHYEALDDPHLRRFFQSPVVLDVVRKTLNVDTNHSFKHDDRSSKMSMTKPRSRSNDPYDHHLDDYRRIVSKGSSGYAKLNGYDCIPTHARPRHVNSTDVRILTSSRRNTTDSRLNHSTTLEKNRTSTQTSVTSFHMDNNKQMRTSTKIRSKEKSKANRPASPDGNFASRSFELRTTNIEPRSTAENNSSNNSIQEKNPSVLASLVSQV